MNFVQNNLANVLTLGNLFLGCVGSIQLILGDYRTTALCLIGSLVLDFLDGFVARALKANSNLGVQLDSLADMVSFGFLPGLTLYKALEDSGNIQLPLALTFDLKYIGLLVCLFSGIRLAIFNLDEEQKYYFKGLNTPSTTLFIFGLYYAFKEENAFAYIFENKVWLTVLSLICSWLLVSPIKMIAFKFKSRKLQDNYPKIVLLLGCALLLFSLGITGIPLCILYYVLISLLFQKSLT
ncbi:CDP-alcohol phosphatidyltransferase [Elizabethkingia argentiflava]|uniref:CDP-alcohol phosphatidyltransferase n=1 Tax=Elizabethkingia argenteiflava TaxID=2681556 RepID=A0A845PTY9_9FLAO|nr:CDP-alcohol phosphatidyltransferase family protein [Elizabethkingia argenteiflava]NAW50533.1 CDP-alcohol phosphatidyltransferase [Elizabethkingia argenteiflava]